MYTCSVNMFTVRMNVCMCVVAFRKKYHQFYVSFIPFAITPLALLLRLSNLFILLMTF